MTSLAARLPACVLAALLVTGCASTPEPPRVPDMDPVIVQLSSSARNAFDRGSYAQAAVMFEKALARARAMDRGPDIGRAAYNLAACRMAEGNAEEAYALLREATAEFRQAEMPSSAMDVLLARAARQLGRNDEAAALVASIIGGKAEPALRAEALLLRGSWSLADGSTDAALADLEAAKKTAGRSGGAEHEAGAASLSGAIATALGAPGTAAQHHDREAAAWSRAKRFRDAALALRRAGDAWKQAEDAGKAAERLYRASRSLYAQGDAVAALATVNDALQLCEAAGNEDLSERVAMLFSEIRDAVEGSARTAAR